MRMSPLQIDRAVGALLGTAAGDALGAKYEFGPPLPDTQELDMDGGGPWEPGEWTDDTSMAIPIARILARGDSLDDEACLDELVAVWTAWTSQAKDVGVQTSQLLHSLPSPDAAASRAAAAVRYATEPRASGGNGTLMRTAPVALGYLADDREADLARAARAVSDLTHGDPDAGDACVLWSLAIRQAIRTGELDLNGQLQWLPVARRARWGSLIGYAEQHQPRDYSHNDWVVEALQGAWSAITHGDGLVDTLERAVRGGRDADTVAAIAGGLAGAVHGGSAVPARWGRMLHGWPGLRSRGLVELAVLASRQGESDDLGWPTTDRVSGSGRDTLVVHPYDDGVYLASIDGLDRLPDDVDTVVSLCRIGRHQTGRTHVEFWLVDAPGKNNDVDAVLVDAADTIAALRAEGRRVAVHCVEARSRTAAVALTYAVRHRGASFVDAQAATSAALPDCEPKQFLLDAVARIEQAGESPGEGVVGPIGGPHDERNESRVAPEPQVCEPAMRFRLAQSWWIAAELARRNGLDVYETHPGGGMYDVLAVVRIAPDGTGQPLLEMNRGGHLHLPDTIGWLAWHDVLTAEDPHDIVHRVEAEMGLSPLPRPTTTRKVLAYRVIARTLAAMVDDERMWDARMGFNDDSGDYASGPRRLVDELFPHAVAHARRLPVVQPWDGPHTHLWMLGQGILGPRPRISAVISDDGHLFLPGRAAPTDLMALYDASTRRLGPVVGAVIGHLLR